MGDNGLIGVFATRPIGRNELVVHWGGELVDDDQLRALPANRRLFFVQVDHRLHLGPPETGPDDGEYFNHSCDPNCGFDGRYRLVAMRDIARDEQLTFDYAMAEMVDQPFECACGSPRCRLRLRADDSMGPDLRRRYAGYYSSWIEETLASSS